MGLCDVCNLRMAVMEKFCFYYHFELGWELYEKRNRGGISEVYNGCVGMKYEMRSDHLQSLHRDWCNVFYTCIRPGGNGAPLLLWLYTVS